MASMAYREQDGVNRQFCPSMGESVVWYTRMSATNTLPTEQVSLEKETADRFGALVVVEFGRPGTCNEDQVDIFRQAFAMDAIDLPQIALDTIAYDCIAHFARDRETEFPPLSIPLDGKADQFGTHVFSAVFKNGPVLPLSREPLPLWQCIWPGHKTRFLRIRRRAASVPWPDAAE